MLIIGMESILSGIPSGLVPSDKCMQVWEQG